MDLFRIYFMFCLIPMSNGNTIVMLLTVGSKGNPQLGTLQAQGGNE